MSLGPGAGQPRPSGARSRPVGGSRRLQRAQPVPLLMGSLACAVFPGIADTGDIGRAEAIARRAIGIASDAGEAGNGAWARLAAGEALTASEGPMRRGRLSRCRRRCRGARNGPAVAPLSRCARQRLLTSVRCNGIHCPPVSPSGNGGYALNSRRQPRPRQSGQGLSLIPASFIDDRHSDRHKGVGWLRALSARRPDPQRSSPPRSSSPPEPRWGMSGRQSHAHIRLGSDHGLPERRRMEVLRRRHRQPDRADFLRGLCRRAGSARRGSRAPSGRALAS